MDTYAYDHGLPCLNPSCRSHGRPHPNCRCYSGGEPPGSNFSQGGEVHYCSENRPHQAGCEFFKDGGDIAEVNAGIGADPHTTLGHSAVKHGLHGLMTKTGHAGMAKTDKNDKILSEMKQSQIPSEDTPSNTFGRRLWGHLAVGDHEKAAKHLQGHSLTGNVSTNDLVPILGKLAQPLLQNEPHPEGLRSSVDYLHSAIRGHHTLDNHMEDMFS